MMNRRLAKFKYGLEDGFPGRLRDFFTYASSIVLPILQLIWWWNSHRQRNPDQLKIRTRKTHTRLPLPVTNGVINPCKWPCKQVTRVITLVKGVITPLTTCFLGPPCSTPKCQVFLGYKNDWTPKRLLFLQLTGGIQLPTIHFQGLYSNISFREGVLPIPGC